jgi:hypothetical protein
MRASPRSRRSKRRPSELCARVKWTIVFDLTFAKPGRAQTVARQRCPLTFSAENPLFQRLPSSKDPHFTSNRLFPSATRRRRPQNDKQLPGAAKWIQGNGTRRGGKEKKNYSATEAGWIPGAKVGSAGGREKYARPTQQKSGRAVSSEHSVGTRVAGTLHAFRPVLREPCRIGNYARRAPILAVQVPGTPAE